MVAHPGDCYDVRVSRPHEDRERHTLVDHRRGGEAVRFASGSWVVIGVGRVKAERSDACVAAYETLVEKARTSNIHAGPVAIVVSHDRRRVVTMVGVRGHDGFRHLAAAWDDHHRFAQRRAIAESVSLGLYEVAASTGAADLDPSSHDAYDYEQLDRPVPKFVDVLAGLDALTEFRGATILHGDAGQTTVILSRFAHIAAFVAFRASRDATNALGLVDAPGTSSFPFHPTRTFDASPARSSLV